MGDSDPGGQFAGALNLDASCVCASRPHTSNDDSSRSSMGITDCSAIGCRDANSDHATKVFVCVAQLRPYVDSFSKSLSLARRNCCSSSLLK